MAPSNVDLRWRCMRGSAAYSTRRIRGWQEDSAQQMTPACPLWLLPDSYKKSETRLSPALPRRLVNKTSRQRLGPKTVLTLYFHLSGSGMGAGHVGNNVKNVSPEAACCALVAPRAELRKPVATNRLGFALAGPGHLWKQCMSTSSDSELMS